MFLDTFVCTSESSIPDLNDLQLECAVSLEAAYNDMVLENCQLKVKNKNPRKGTETTLHVLHKSSHIHS